MKVFSMFMLCCFALSCMQAARIQARHTCHFEKDQFSLSESEIMLLTKFYNQCDVELEHQFIIKGHTDSDGSIYYNEELSKNRVETVSKLLNSYGAELHNLATTYHSEVLPIATNSHANGMALNRRVTIHFEATYFHDLSEVREELMEGTSTKHRLQMDQENKVQGQNGVTLLIPPGAFVGSDGQVVNQAELEIVEALELSSFMGHNLQTQAEDGILISGGMIRLSAVDQDGNALSIKDDSKLLVSIPDEARQDSMSLWTTNNQGSSWQPDEEPILNPSLLAGKAPDQPYMDHHRKYLKEFYYKKRKPSAPIIYSEPVPPVEPKRSAYVTEKSFLSIFRKDSLAKRDQKRYEMALDTYKKRFERYTERHEAWEVKRDNFPNELKAYKEDSIEFEYFKSAAELDYKDRIVPEFQAREEERYARASNLYEARMEKWRDDYNDWADEYALAAEKLGLNRTSEIGQYVFKANQLGWVNIDRYSKMPDAICHSLEVKTSGSESEERVFVVLNDGRSLIKLNGQDREFELKRIAKNEDAHLIAYTIVDGRLHLYEERFRGKRKFKADYQPSSIAELKEVLQSMDNQLSAL